MGGQTGKQGMPAELRAKLAAVRDLAAAGAAGREIIARLGVSPRTFYRWQRKYPELKAAAAGRRRGRWEELGIADRLPAVREWAAAGLPYDAVARRLGVSFPTLCRWRRERPELAAALARSGKPVRGRGRWEDREVRERLKEVEEWAAAGATDAAIARRLGVSPGTVGRWKKEQPEFMAALRAGRKASDAVIEESSRRYAVGYSYVEEVLVKLRDGKKERYEIVPVVRHVKPNASMLQFILRSHLPETYGGFGPPAGRNP